MELLRLKAILKEKGITGKDLAESVDVNPNTISRIVKGSSFPSGELLLKIANELDVDIKDLFYSTRETTRETVYVLRDNKYISIGQLNLNAGEEA